MFFTAGNLLRPYKVRGMTVQIWYGVLKQFGARFIEKVEDNIATFAFKFNPVRKFGCH